MNKKIAFRNYTDRAGMTDDYFKVRAFLAERGYCEFTYARWDWMATHVNLERGSVGRIGMWEDGGRLVALAVFDCRPGGTFLPALPGYGRLRGEMISYAVAEFGGLEDFRLIIPDGDRDYMRDAGKNGFEATPDREFDAAIFPGGDLPYTLPDGFRITDLDETPDLRQYERILWKGFDHERNGEGFYDDSGRDGSLSAPEIFRPNVDRRLKLAVLTPGGSFCAYCGMWYDGAAGFGVIEPVAVDPDYRRLGLGRAAVLEGVKRVFRMGARFAVVGSSQQFYYSIGLTPFASSSAWRLKKR